MERCTVCGGDHACGSDLHAEFLGGPIDIFHDPGRKAFVRPTAGDEAGSVRRRPGRPVVQRAGHVAGRDDALLNEQRFDGGGHQSFVRPGLVFAVGLPGVGVVAAHR